MSQSGLLQKIISSEEEDAAPDGEPKKKRKVCLFVDVVVGVVVFNVSCFLMTLKVVNFVSFFSCLCCTL